MKKTILTIRTTGRGTWREIFGGMVAFAKICDWEIQPVDARLSRPDFAALASFWHPDGWILEAGGGAENIRDADLGDLPAVAINSGESFCGISAEIGCNQQEIARVAMGELLRLAPVSLAVVSWFERSSWALGRIEASRKIASLHGLALKEISPGHDCGSVRAIEQISENIRNLKKPIGIFAVSDDVGRIVLAAVARLNLNVPGDVAVVSVDDDPEVCENCNPTLTSVRPNYHRLGFDAASTLHRFLETSDRVKVNGNKGGCCIYVPISGVMRRASTEAMRHQDAKVIEALEMIRLHACDGLTTTKIVELFGTSLHTAESRFKMAMGHTIGDEIMKRRLDSACSYLREGTSSIEAIANFCGWNSATAFRKAFRGRLGMSPLKWKKML